MDGVLHLDPLAIADRFHIFILAFNEWGIAGMMMDFIGIVAGGVAIAVGTPPFVAAGNGADCEHGDPYIASARSDHDGLALVAPPLFPEPGARVAHHH